MRFAQRRIGETVRCGGCPAVIIVRGGLQKYCAECLRRAKNERNKESERLKRRSAGNVELGSEMVCRECLQPCKRTNGQQLYCGPCGSRRKQRLSSVSKQKYEANAPRRVRNTPADRLRRMRWAEKNTQKLRRKWQKYNLENREHINRKARERNRTPKRKKWRRHWENERAASDPKFRLNARMKQSVKRGLRHGKGGRSWTELIGYTVAALSTHIEKQFQPGMSWSNMGEWHIDHRVPLALFRFETADDPEFRAAWALTNLQPMWAQENWSKHARRVVLL